MKCLLQYLSLICVFITTISTLANAQSGLALSLNGVDGFMKVADHNDIDIDAGESFSITLWFRTSSTGDYYRIISKRDGAGYEMITQQGPGAYGMNLRSVNNTNSGPPFGSTSVTDGTWHHLAMIVNTDNSTPTIYVDGSQEQQSNVGAIGTESFANDVDFLVGTEISENVFTPGFLDNIRLWSTPLSQTEIEADMTAMVDGTENNLIAAYDFENVSGTVVPDLKGNHPGNLCGGVVIFDPNTPMAFSSTALVQRDIPVGIGESDEGVMAVNVSTIGNIDPLELSALTFNMNGTTEITDIENIKIYYTESSERFATTNLFGTASVAAGNTTITGNQLLGEGSNYFWVTYDLADSATEGHFIDAEILSVTVAGNEETLANSSLDGNDVI